VEQGEIAVPETEGFLFCDSTVPASQPIPALVERSFGEDDVVFSDQLTTQALSTVSAYLKPEK